MKIALFVDFDNVYSGLRRISAEAAERFSRQPLRWLSWLTTGADDEDIDETSRSRRRVLVRRCYLNPVMYQKYRRPFHEAGFEIVDCPPMTATGKTSTDIHLVLDTMDALMDETHFDEFVVFSADADFSPMLRRLRRHDRRTVVFAAGAMSESYKASADRVIDIQTFLRDALQLASVEDEEEVSAGDEVGIDEIDSGQLRKLVMQRVRDMVLNADHPIALPALAQFLHREIEGLREGRWDSAGSFGGLMRELNMPDIDFDFSKDIAVDRRRMGSRSVPATDTAALDLLPVPSADSKGSNAPCEAASEPLPLDGLRNAAEKVIRQAVGNSKGPLHLSTLAPMLRQAVPQLANGWADAPNLAAFLKQLHIEPLQRAVLENGSTVVLYDPARHDVPARAVEDRLVVSMLRAAELPEMKGADLVRILTTARAHMGGGESFELAEVSRNVAGAMTAGGRPVSPRRVVSVLQAMIFGGLDPTKAYPDEQDLIAVSIGVILSAWARESQTVPDEDAKSRLLAWLGPAVPS